MNFWFMSHNFRSQYSRKSFKGSKDADFGIVSKKILSQHNRMASYSVANSRQNFGGRGTQRVNPSTTAKAHILAPTFLATTRQAIELESYPYHPRIQQVFGSKSKNNAFRFGVRWGHRYKWVFFGHLYLSLDPFGNYFGSRCFWKLGQNLRL